MRGHPDHSTRRIKKIPEHTWAEHSEVKRAREKEWPNESSEITPEARCSGEIEPRRAGIV